MQAGRIIFLFFVIMTMVTGLSRAQRAFLSNVNGHSRNYLLFHPSHDGRLPNLPLVIVLRPAGSSNGLVSDSLLARLGKPAIIIFPSAIGGHWGCEEEKSLMENMDFLSRIVQESYDNFHIDRNKVFMITHEGSICLAERFLEQHPQIVTATRHITSSQVHAEAIQAMTNDLLNIRSRSEPAYALWENPLYTEEVRRQAVMDSIKRVRWERRVTLEFRTGGFFMLSSVKTEKDKTYMDISDAHSIIDLHVTSWMNDSMAWFVDVGWLKVPQKAEFNGARIEAGGGMILPITFGLRYAFHHRKTRPYILLGTGPIPVMVFGGRFRMTSDPSQVRNKIKAEIRFAFQTTIGTGIDYRLGKRILMGGHLRYIHSSKFESAGAVNAIRGFNASFSAGYILGTNRLGRTKN